MLLLVVAFGYPLFVLSLEISQMVDLRSISTSLRHYDQVLDAKELNIRERDYNETAFLPHNKYFGISNNNNRGI